MTNVLIDPQFGARSCAPVAEYVNDTEVWPASRLRSEIGIMQASDVLADLKSEPRRWETAIGVGGLGFGGGPAAALVSCGWAKKAILIDPATLLVHDADLTLLDSKTSYVDSSGSRETLMRILPDSDTKGPFHHEVYHALAEQLTPDPDVRNRLAIMWQNAEEERQPYNETIPLKPDSETSEQLNWLHAWAKPDLDVTVWLSANRAPLAGPLQDRAPGRPLVVQPWPSWAWLSDPGLLARALTEALA